MRSLKILLLMLVFTSISLHVIASDGVRNNLVDVTYPGENDLDEGQVRVIGRLGALPGGILFTLTNIDTGNGISVTSNSDGSFEVELSAEPGHVLDLQIKEKFAENEFSSFISGYQFMVEGGSHTLMQLRVDLTSGWMLKDEGINMLAGGNLFSSAFTTGYLFN